MSAAPPSVAPTRLVGSRVALVPVTVALARAVVDNGGISGALAPLGLTAARGWPHADTAAVLRAAGSGAVGASWLVVVAGEVVGDAGCGPPDESGEVEIGYGLAPRSRGGGVGTEAVALLLVWLGQQPGLRTVCAQVHPGNEASLRLLWRLGFREQSRASHIRLTRSVEAPARPRGRHVC